METILRILVYVTAACSLCVVNVWFVSLVVQSLSSRAFPSTIAPVRVVGADDPAGKNGQALAAMLLARLGRIRGEITASFAQLNAPAVAIGPRPQQHTDPVVLSLPERMLEPLELDMKIGGLEVGGLLSWIHGRLTTDNALLLSIESRNGYALASGVWNQGKDSVWVEVSDSDTTKPIPNESIATAVAYALTQKQFETRVPEIGALTNAEFQQLLSTLSSAAVLQRQVDLGRAAGSELQAVSTRIGPLVEKMPRWFELTLLAAKLADNAGDTPRAIALYRTAVVLAKDSSRATAELETRIESLTSLLASTPVEVEGVPRTARVGGWPLTAIGVDSTEMSGAPRIAVLGGPPDGQSARYEFVGQRRPPPKDGFLAEYVQTLVEAVELVAPEAKFVFSGSALGGGSGAGTNADILKDLNDVVSANPDVLLVTFGPLPPATFAPVFDRIAAQGIVVVIAAGNEPGKPVPFEGMPLASKIAVASSVGPDGAASPFTQRGDKVLWAPGQDIPLAVGNRSGTSYSAALAAGVAARMLAEDPTLKSDRLLEILRATSKANRPANPAVINLSAALEELD